MSFKMHCSYCNELSTVKKDSDGKFICTKCGKEIGMHDSGNIQNKQPLPNNVTKLEKEIAVNDVSTQKNQPPNNTTIPKSFNVLNDEKEDNYVINNLGTIKAICWFLCMIICFVLLLWGLSQTAAYNTSLPFIIAIIIDILLVFYCFVFTLISSWFRGIYRNVALMKSIMLSSANNNKKDETNGTHETNETDK